ncbi:MAG: hypothetical protein D6722_19730 [Bacteroidetes bacterium]|nr:MAG: hypothetical protein D6722_19730 [Bacteroidota bacterium]
MQTSLKNLIFPVLLALICLSAAPMPRGGDRVGNGLASPTDGIGRGGNGLDAQLSLPHRGGNGLTPKGGHTTGNGLTVSDWAFADSPAMLSL